MKLHLSIALLSAVLALYAVDTVQAAPTIPNVNLYMNEVVDSPSYLEDYSRPLYSRLLFSGDVVISPSSVNSWTASSRSFMEYGYVILSSKTTENAALSSLAFENASSAAFYGMQSLSFEKLNSLSFSNISDNGYGSGAIGVYSYMSIAEVSTVTFSGNYSSNRGGAIYTTGTSEIVNNGDMSFINNVADNVGGAIYNSGTLTFDNNGKIIFSGNQCATYEDCSEAGGAIYSNTPGKLTLSRNEEVTFRGNSSAGAGAICAMGDMDIIENKEVNFSDNYTIDGGGGAIRAEGHVNITGNESVNFTGNDSQTSGGAIFITSRDTIPNLVISGNKTVNFSDNSSTRLWARGGAICAKSAGAIILSENGSMTFSGNFADYWSGAISAEITDLIIQGNDSVLFEKNYVHSSQSGSYQLRGIYAAGNNFVLSAKTGGNISIFDSLYSGGVDTQFNVDYVDSAGNTQRAGGDIILSGKYTESHLNDILLANGENRTATADEIRNSRTSEIYGTLTLGGGSLQVVDKAILKVNGLNITVTSGSGATLKVADAELVATKATVNVQSGATLEVGSGAQIDAKAINIASGAIFSIGGLTATEVSMPEVALLTMSRVDSAVATVFNGAASAAINANLTFEAGSTLMTDGTGVTMGNDSVLTFKAISGGDKINLVLTLGAEYDADTPLILFSDVDMVKFIMDGKELSTESTLLASDFFTGDCVNEDTTLLYDAKSGALYLQSLAPAVPEPTTATLGLLALAALAARRRRR